MPVVNISHCSWLTRDVQTLEYWYSLVYVVVGLALHLRGNNDFIRRTPRAGQQLDCTERQAFNYHRLPGSKHTSCVGFGAKLWMFTMVRKMADRSMKPWPNMSFVGVG
jgi:hypothetical protein